MLKASPPAEPLVDWRSEISAGLISSLVCLPLCLACGLLVFAPLGPDYVAAGAAAGLYGGAIVGLVAAVVATSSYIVTTSRVSMALVQAGLTTTLVNDATLASQPAMIVTAIMLCLFLAGLWQVLFGLLGLTRAIKFAPHPVLTGLLNGVGMLIVISQFKPFFAAQTLWPNKPAMLVYVVALALFVLNYPAIAGWLRLPDWLRKIPGSLAGFVAGTALYYLISVPTGLDLGPTIGEIHVSFPPAMPLGAVFDGSITPELTAVLPHVVLVSLVLAIIGTVETMLAFRVAQQLDDTHIHPVRDLAAQGIANAAAALGGGIGGSAIPSVILLGYRMGGRTRWTSIFVALSLLAITFALSSVLAQVPRAVFAGLLLVIGIVLFDRWNLQLLADIRYSIEPQVRRHAVYNLIVVLAVMAVTVFSSVVSGVDRRHHPVLHHLRHQYEPAAGAPRPSRRHAVLQAHSLGRRSRDPAADRAAARHPAARRRAVLRQCRRPLAPRQGLVQQHGYDPARHGCHLRPRRLRHQRIANPAPEGD